MRPAEDQASGPSGIARDAALWKSIQSGDVSAFETLFRCHAPALCDFALALAGDEHAARDMVHAVFCWIWEHRHTLEAPRVVRAYLFAAVRNRVRNHQRDARVSAAFLERLARSGEPLVHDEPPTDARAIAADLEEALARELANLPPRCREVFALLRYEGLSHAEAATTLGISQKTVEIHVGRALKQLRTRLANWL
ncbi:MAG: RNA polymerase sigma-70 factor [bacterium]